MKDPTSPLEVPSGVLFLPSLFLKWGPPKAGSKPKPPEPLKEPPKEPLNKIRSQPYCHRFDPVFATV
jgi:hypothetical protein